MKYTFSKHAIEQIERRNISRTVIDEVISHPENIIKHDNCVKVFQKVIDDSPRLHDAISLYYDNT